MILYSNGTQLDFFDKFPSNLQKIGIYLSGGTDSALILYILVKMLQERQDCHVQIYPVAGYDASNPDVIAWDVCERIINWIKDNTKFEGIQPLLVTPFIDETETKISMFRANRKYLKHRYNIDVVIDGISLGMPHSSRDGRDIDIWTTDEKIKTLYNDYPHEYPWSTVDKKFIADQYKKFNIEELSNITNSCVASSKTPCKKCWWCRERYWAFGSYDGGLQ